MSIKRKIKNQIKIILNVALPGWSKMLYRVGKVTSLCLLA